MQRHNGSFPFIRLQEGQRDLGIHESVFGENSGAVGVLEDVERSLEVWISVGIIRADAMPRQMLSGRLVQAVSQLVGQGVSVVGVGAPAGGIVPHQATAGRIDVDGYQKGLLDGMTYLAGNPVGPAYSFFEGDVVFLGYEQFGIIATQLEVFDHSAGYLSVVLVLAETSVRRAFARGLDPVAIIYQNLHFL